MTAIDIARAIRTFIQNFSPGDVAIDHRAAVGGMWHAMGPLQFEFMKARGLKPHHVLLDIGCGSLRAGRLFIDYLEPGHYLGVDAEQRLVSAGLKTELPPNVLAEKRPEFAVTDRFDFKFTRKPDFAIAQSLFSHLTPRQIVDCLTKLKSLAPECVLFATFCQAPFRLPKIFGPHSQRTFFYTIAEMRHCAKASGWQMEYIGHWDHPRGQRMLRFY
jgi:hypothetical protein